MEAEFIPGKKFATSCLVDTNNNLYSSFDVNEALKMTVEEMILDIIDMDIDSLLEIEEDETKDVEDASIDCIAELLKMTEDEMEEDVLGLDVDKLLEIEEDIQEEIADVIEYDESIEDYNKALSMLNLLTLDCEESRVFS